MRDVLVVSPAMAQPLPLVGPITVTVAIGISFTQMSSTYGVGDP